MEVGKKKVEHKFSLLVHQGACKVEYHNFVFIKKILEMPQIEFATIHVPIVLE